MTITIQDSLTKKKRELKPRDKKTNTIRMYSCGVTVYDRCHIGHARSLYIFDVIRKYLQYRGYKVHFVRNITDIDDKIINKANELGISSEEVATRNIADYYRDLERLQIDKADEEPRATENIPEMIVHIQGLIEKGFAYESGGDVYFSVRKFKGYGKLSGQSVEHMMEAVRIEKDGKKKDSLDFALWKESKEGEPSWESPWGKGRPGWHIECSVMSMKHLKAETIDIHAGGRDLIFPHHENEIAQSEALTGKSFAQYWIHHGLLTINGQKMAKSLGNFITVKDAVDQYGAEAIKMFFLSAHYSSPLDFTEERMEDAKKSLERIRIFVQKLGDLASVGVAGEEAAVARFKSDFLAAMDDDFNTPQGLSVIFELVNEGNKMIDDGKEKHEGALKYAYGLLTECLGIFGLGSVFAEGEAISDEARDILEQRQTARKNKDFKRSDELRDKLSQMGITVEDTPQGQQWRKA